MCTVNPLSYLVWVKVVKNTFFFLCHVRIRWSGPDLRHILLDSGAPEGPPPLCALWPLRVIAARGRCRGHLSPLASPPAEDAAVDGVGRLRSSVGLGRPIGCQLTKGRKELGANLPLLCLRVLSATSSISSSPPFDLQHPLPTIFPVPPLDMYKPSDFYLQTSKIRGEQRTDNKK